MRHFFFLFLVVGTPLFSKPIQLKEARLEVEIADTPELRSKGLMGRRSLQENTGMLFVYEKEKILVFWMKNTWIPLSIGFFDQNKILFQILHMNPPHKDRLLKYFSSAPAQYALEVPQGWFEKNKIRLGDKFSFLKTPDALE